MSETTSEASGEVHRIAQGPSLLTSSLRESFDAFAEDIIRPQAHGSVETTNRTAVDNLRQYNGSRQQRMSIACEQIFQTVMTVLDSIPSTGESDSAGASNTLRSRANQTMAVTPVQTLREAHSRPTTAPCSPCVTGMTGGSK